VVNSAWTGEGYGMPLGQFRQDILEHSKGGRWQRDLCVKMFVVLNPEAEV
jgi:hypothetical protein